MMPGNMNNLMRQAQKMQAEMQAQQEALEQKEFTASTGGNAVTVTMTGKHELKSVVLSPEVVDPEDIEMLQDLISAAFNEATKKVDDMMASEMGKLTSGLGLPPGLF
jgi:DNA-binding YbaB/EbfC family protein